jgi:hypothetical protein
MDGRIVSLTVTELNHHAGAGPDQRSRRRCLSFSLFVLYLLIERRSRRCDLTDGTVCTRALDQCMQSTKQLPRASLSV